ncbi:MAG: hypothetical protein ABMA25_14235 [Ilumatobacteraceae bacterium]
MTAITDLERLTRRLDRLEAENEALRNELRSAAPMPEVTSRRQWLARGAVLAVGAVAGAVAFSPRADAIGSPINMGLNNISPTPTTTRLDASIGDDVLSSVFYALNGATDGAGLHGYGPSYGVLGFSDKGTGVWGKASGDASHAAVGIGGYIDNPDSPGSSGVQGVASGAGQVGVKGQSTDGWAGWFSSTFSDLTLGMPSRVAPTSDVRYHSYGDVVAETGSNKATLWFCVVSGTPGTWRRLGGSNTAGAMTLLPSPIRVYDSRAGQAPIAIGPKAPLATDVDRAIDCTLNTSGVPSDAVGVLINVTATNQTGGGYLSVRANGVTYANTSNLNWTAAGQTIANAATIACGGGAKIAVRLGGAAAANVIIDVVGYVR